MARAACVVGSGPNGLAAAIVLAAAGVPVEVFEAEAQPGGAARSLELTLPGFIHDFGSAVHPLAAGSPFLSSLPLANHGLRWIHAPAALAHPLNDGTAILIERSIDETSRNLGRDGYAWKSLVEPFAERWPEFAAGILGPMLSIPGHPFLLARFVLKGILPATELAQHVFATQRTRALFAGLAAHSFLSLDEPLTAAFGIVLGAAAHSVGWPIPSRGAQSITNALCGYLASIGGLVRTSTRIDSLESLSGRRPILCDAAPRQLVRIAGSRLSKGYRRSLAGYRYGPGVFKIDYALREPIPWTAQECRRAATVHLGGTMQEIAASEYEMRHGRTARYPFVILAQPTLFDPDRAPAGRHTAWAYCHVPNGCTANMQEALESQIERFAPGFRECVMARRVFSPSALESMDANLIGGDISGGANNWIQMLLRPTWRRYMTSDRDIYICSASTPPGGGVHGMCGFHAATLALKRSV